MFLRAISIFFGFLMATALFAEAESAGDSPKIRMPLHPTPWTIDGKPILGTYTGGGDMLTELKRVHEVGMNVVLGHAEDLDPTTPTGAYCLEHGIKVIVHITSHVYHGVKLRDAVTPEQTKIPLHFDGGARDPESKVIQFDDERIRYNRIVENELVDCERGIGGTKPAVHREGTILFWPEPCEQEIAKLKDSPNLFGYYTLDDSPGDAASVLRGIYSAVQRFDPGKKHPVISGFGDAGSVVNLTPGVCDILAIYWYPVGSRSYERERTSQEVQRILTAARSRVPGIPFVGIYQAFDGRPLSTGQGVPTPEQLREQLEDFVREGATGLVAFYSGGSGMPGWADLPDLGKVIKDVNDEIRSSGGLLVAPETESMAEARIQPAGFWEHPTEVPGVVPAWYLVGPFEDSGQALLDAPFPPDTVLDLSAVYPVKFGTSAWRVWPTTCGVVGFTNIFGDQRTFQNCVVYALCEVSLPEERKVLLNLGSDDDAWVRVNGKEVYRHEGARGLTYDKETIPVTLPAGKSTVLAKVYNRVGMWGLYLRLTDLDGSPLSGVTFSPVAP